MSDDQEVRYKVTFLGPVKNDLPTVTKLAGGLKDQFNLSDEAVTRMMKMVPVVIKKGATVSEAQKYKQVFEAIGAKVQVDPIEAVPEEPQQTEQTSPPPADAGAEQQTEQSPPPPVEEGTGQHVTEEGPAPLDREPQVIPVRAKTPPPESPETVASQAQETKATEPQMTQCPQCGYVQEQTDECIKCGVIISKFLKYQDTVQPPGIEAAAPGADGTSAEGPHVQRIVGTPLEERTGSTPWEDMASLGFFTAFFKTMMEVLFSPIQFFKKMPVNTGIPSPLFYGVIIIFLATIISLLSQFMLLSLTGSFSQMKGMEGMVSFQATILIIYAFLLPIMIVIGLFIISLVFHLCLMIVGAGKRGFEATFRVVAYTGSTQAIALVPFIGPFAYFIYTFVIYVIGFREAHRTTTGRAFIAVLIPLLAIGFFIVLIIFAVLIPLFFSSGQMMIPEQPPSGF